MMANLATGQIDSTIGRNIDGVWILKQKVKTEKQDTVDVGKYNRDKIVINCLNNTFRFIITPQSGNLITGTHAIKGNDVLDPLKMALRSGYPSSNFALHQVGNDVIAFQSNSYIYIFERE